MVNTRIVQSSRDIAVLGDSISEYNHTAPLPGLQEKAIGYMAQARAMAMGRFNFTPDLNFGKSSDTAALILARTGSNSLAALIARAPARVCLLIGTNDIGQDTAKETIWANILTILNTLNSAGIPVDIVPVLPRTNAQTTARRQVSQWLKRKMLAELSNRLQRLYSVLPLDEALIDRASSTGDPIASALSDGLHPGVYGAALMGRAAATYYSSLFPELPVLGGLSQNDLYDATYNPLGAIVSGPIPINSGGSAGTGASGSVATNYSVNRVAGSALTMGCAKTTLTDENGGVVQDIAIGGTGGIAYETGIFNGGSAIVIPAGLSVGQKILLEADVETIGMSSTFKGVSLICNSSISGEANSLRLSTAPGERDLTAARRLLRTPPITITSPGVETISKQLLFAADCSGAAPSGTIRIRSLALRAMP